MFQKFNKAGMALLFILLFSMSSFAATSVSSWAAVTTMQDGSAITGPVTYNLYRSGNATMAGKNKLNTTPITALTYTDTTAPGGVDTNYQVFAVAPDGTEGIGSVIIKFNSATKTPAAPGTFTVK